MTIRRPRARLVLACLAVTAVAIAATVMTMSLHGGKPANAVGRWGPDTCLYGHVWRGATSSDHVCVTSQRRDTVAYENQLALSLRNPSGPWGPDSCKDGWVWREATPDDHACVTSASYNLVHDENNNAWQTRAIDAFSKHMDWTTSDGGNFQWWYTLELSYTGAFTFKGAINNLAQGVPQKYSVVCTVETLDNHVLAFEASGSLGIGEQKSWNSPIGNPSGELVNHWEAIAPGTQAHCQARQNADVATTLSKIKEVWDWGEKIVTIVGAIAAL
jgi:hypothetical protein